MHQQPMMNMGMHPLAGADNSFEQEVQPIQQQLENRFHPMEGVLPPPGVQGINGLGSEGFQGMQQVPLPPLNPMNPTQQLMQM